MTNSHGYLDYSHVGTVPDYLRLTIVIQPNFGKLFYGPKG